MKDEEYKELLSKAIDNYDLISFPSSKALLKKLIDLQQNNEVITTISKLAKYVSNNRVTISINLKKLQADNFIEADLKQGKKLRSILIKPDGLAKIIDHYLSTKDLN